MKVYAVVECVPCSGDVLRGVFSTWGRADRFVAALDRFAVERGDTDMVFETVEFEVDAERMPWWGREDA